MINKIEDPINTIRKDPENQNWYKEPLSEDFIVEFFDKINFECIIKNDNITEEVKEFCKIFI